MNRVAEKHFELVTAVVVPSECVTAERELLVNHYELSQQHPDILADRPDTSFTKSTDPAEIAHAFGESGVAVLRRALPRWTLWTGHRIFRRFIGDLSGKPRMPAWHSGYENILAKDDWPDTKGADRETEAGSTHMPWVVRDYNRSPAAMVIRALLRSWTWPVVEKLCKSPEIAILLDVCFARHMLDKVEPFVTRRDVDLVGSKFLFTIWIPFQSIVLGRNPGLGFAPGPPNSPGDLWIPAYKTGDISIHGPYTPYLTTCSGVPSDSYSLEIRTIAREAAPLDRQDPAIYVSRRNGRPTVVGSNCSDARRAKGFLRLFAS